MGRVTRRSKTVTPKESPVRKSPLEGKKEQTTVRHSGRHRVVNKRYGTPPKIFKAIITKKVEGSKSKGVPSSDEKKVVRKQTIKAVKEAVQAAPAAVVRHSQRTRVANRRYDSPFDDVISDSVNANKKPPPPPVIAKEESSKITSKTRPNVKSSDGQRRSKSSNLSANQSMGSVRHSKRQPKPNRRYSSSIVELSPAAPKTIQPAKKARTTRSFTESNAKERKPIEVKKENEEESVEQRNSSEKEASPKTEITLRHSTRRRVPSRRLEISEAKPQRALSARRKRTDKTVKSGKKRMSREISGGPPLKNENRQNHNDSSQSLFVFNPLRDRPLCVNKMSTPSSSKEYISKHDIDEVLEKVFEVFHSIPWRKDLPALEKKLSDCMFSLHRFNCRLRNANRELKTGIENISTNATPVRCAQLMKQVEELREEKVLAQIRNEAQAKEIKDLQARINYLTSLGRTAEDQQGVRDFYANNVPRETEYVVTSREGENTNALANGDVELIVRDDESVEWGGDAWMLRC